MITIKAKRRIFSLRVARSFFLGLVSASIPMLLLNHAVFAAETAMVEAPPPWNAAAPSAESVVQTTATETTVAPATVVATNTAAGSVESWYRNRRKSTVSVDDEMATLQTAARAGDAQAQYRLALLLRSDDTDAAKVQQSITWQTKAAQGGNVQAQYGLGLLYANGQYVTQDKAQAQQWLQQAADQGYDAAKLVLASLDNAVVAPAAATSPVEETASVAPETLPALPVEPETAAPETMAAVPLATQPMPLEPAPEVMETPAPAVMEAALQAPVADPEQSTNNAASASANMDWTGIEPEVVKQSAESGDKQAQLMLGTMYEDGVGGLPSDFRDAAYWYEQAARQGYTKAQYNLGLLYEDGRGVDQDYAKAAYWYEKAAKAGFVEAQNNLGVLYILGNGVKKDTKKAAQLFQAAADKGNADAQRNLDMLKGG